MCVCVCRSVLESAGEKVKLGCDDVALPSQFKSVIAKVAGASSTCASSIPESGVDAAIYGHLHALCSLLSRPNHPLESDVCKKATRELQVVLGAVKSLLRVPQCLDAAARWGSQGRSLLSVLIQCLLNKGAGVGRRIAAQCIHMLCCCVEGKREAERLHLARTLLELDSIRASVDGITAKTLSVSLVIVLPSSAVSTMRLVWLTHVLLLVRVNCIQMFETGARKGRRSKRSNKKNRGSLAGMEIRSSHRVIATA